MSQIDKILGSSNANLFRRAGAYVRLTGIKEASGMQKSAQGYKLLGEFFSPSKWAKNVLALSLIPGIPAGVAWHVADRAVRAKRNKEQELLARKRYFRDATSELEGDLADEGVVI